jgi:hypothetical protein
MSQSRDDREGLSPSPANILDIFTGDEDDDDEMDSYHPTEEMSTDASLHDEEDSDMDFAGNAQTDLAPI